MARSIRTLDAHASQDDEGRPEARRLEHDPRAAQRTDHVADDGYEADQRLDADPTATGAGHDHEVVEDARDEADAPLGGGESGFALMVDPVGVPVGT